MDCGGIAAGADPGERPPPFFDQNEAQRAKKKLGGDRALPLSQNLDDPPPLIWRSGSATVQTDGKNTG